MTKNGKQISVNGSATTISNGKKVKNYNNYQNLIAATVEFDRFAIEKKNDRHETHVSGIMNFDQKVIGKRPLKNKNVRIRFVDFVVRKHNGNTRVNGQVELIAGESTIDEMVQDFLKKF